MDETQVEEHPKERKRVHIGCLSLPTVWANVFFGILAVAGQVGQNVALPLWVDSTNSLTGEPKVDSYFVVSFASLLFVVIFGVGTLFLALFVPGKIGETERKFPIILLAQVGICDGLNGILVVFASSGTRTAPYLQAILGNFIIPITILFRFLILKKIPTKRKFICGLLVVIGLFICLLPTIFPSIDPNSSKDLGGAKGVGKFLWPLCFMLGFVPAAVMNVVEEKGLKLRTRTARKGVNIVYFLFMTSLFQLITVWLFFWADIIPGFGNVKNIHEFGKSYLFGFRCFFGGAGCDAATGTRGTIFISMYVVSYIGGGNLLRYAEGATWLAIVTSLVTPLGFLFWTLFEESPFKWHPVAHVSTWCSIGALALMVPAIYVYNTGPPEVSSDVHLSYDENYEHPVNTESGELAGVDGDTKPLLV